MYRTNLQEVSSPIRITLKKLVSGQIVSFKANFSALPSKMPSHTTMYPLYKNSFRKKDAHRFARADKFKWVHMFWLLRVFCKRKCNTEENTHHSTLEINTCFFYEAVKIFLCAAANNSLRCAGKPRITESNGRHVSQRKKKIYSLANHKFPIRNKAHNNEKKQHVLTRSIIAKHMKSIKNHEPTNTNRYEFGDTLELS